MRRVLVSYLLIQELLLNRVGFVEDADHLWELMRFKQIQGYITPRGLDLIYLLLIDLVGENDAEKEISGIKKVVEVCPVNHSLIRNLQTSKLRNSESAIELAYASYMELNAIVTQIPENFDNTKFPIWSLDELIHQKLEASFKKQPKSLLKVVEKLNHSFYQENTGVIGEKKYYDISKIANKLNRTFYDRFSGVQLSLFQSGEQLSLFHFLDIERAFGYRIRNSINTALKVFKLIKKEGSKGIVRRELEKKTNFSESKTDNIILDLQNLQMVSVQGYKVIVQPYLAKSEETEIAGHIAEILKNYAVTKIIYQHLRANKSKTMTRENLRNIIVEAFSSEKGVKIKSAGDYTSRMLGWLFFSGLLEKRENGLIAKPTKACKNKQREKKETKVQQLTLFAELY
jgi:hypothetical protein